ncbi:MAG: hypothetical protein Kilf2KO_04760 [Rhodospirillales bacterium]
MTRTVSSPSRRRAALGFALVGLLAGGAHVLASEADSLRLWREVLPLACLVGAILGVLFRPARWLSGALVALLAVFGFALAYAVAETAILAGRGEIAGLGAWPASIFHWIGVVLAQSALGGAVAVLAGALAGVWIGRPRQS